MLDVKFYEVFEEERSAIAKLLTGDLRVDYTDKTIQESGDRAIPAGVLSVRTQSVIPQDWKDDVRGILTRSQGYDHLAGYRKASGSRCAMGYLGNYCSRAVAEHAIMAAMMLLRGVLKQRRQFHDFNREGLTGLEFRGRKILVAGVGNIGEETVNIAKGLNMRVKGFDIDPRIEDLDYVGLQEGVGWAEVLICALPLTESTNGLLDYDILYQAGAGLIFVNISRGEISPVADLRRLMDEGRLGGVSMDVYPEEPGLAMALRGDPNAHSKSIGDILELSKREQVLFTPHNAFNTREALAQKAELSVRSVIHFLEHGEFPLSVPKG